MKNNLLLCVLLLAGCASPKYTYNFDYYDYNSGRKPSPVITGEIIPPTAAPVLTADISNKPALESVEHSMPERTIIASGSRKEYVDMSKDEKKAFRKEIRSKVKAYAKAMRKGDTVQANAEVAAMDNDLKMAIIFGAVGLTLSLFGGINEAFWILGVIAIVVGVIFLVKWLVRQ